MSMENELKIEKHAGVYTLTAVQQLPISLEEAWDFFSSPGNLEKITPGEMGFDIVSCSSEKMYPGQIITYKIGILPMIKSSWVTEITQVNAPYFFIDEQRHGPYSIWHHEHHFESNDYGTLMTDRVSYRIPAGFVGRMLHNLFIKKKLMSIFGFRMKTLDKQWSHGMVQEKV